MGQAILLIDSNHGAIRNWEQGKRGPTGAARTLLRVLDKAPETALRVLLMQIADRHYIMEKGRITWTGDSAALAAAKDVRHRYPGVSRGPVA